jgi:hypothetical protein
VPVQGMCFIRVELPADHALLAALDVLLHKVPH